MFAVLRECGALARLLPELLDANPALWALLDQAADAGLDLPQRVAILLHETESLDELDSLCQRLKVPNECRELALALRREIGQLPHAQGWTPQALLACLQRGDAWRRPERFTAMLVAADCILGHTQVSGHILQALRAAQTVNAGEIAKAQANLPGNAAKNIPQAINDARIVALKAALFPDC